MKEKTPKCLSPQDVDRLRHLLEQASASGLVRYCESSFLRYRGTDGLNLLGAKFMGHSVIIRKHSDGYNLLVQRGSRIIAELTYCQDWTELRELWDYFILRLNQKESDDWRSRALMDLIRSWENG